MDELSAWLVLARAPGLHGAQLQALLQHHSSVTALLRASPATLRASGMSDAAVEWLVAHRDLDVTTDLQWLEEDGHHFVAWGSPLYPPLLAEIPDAPLLKALAEFAGVDRRLQVLGTATTAVGRVTFVDDYGHHPTELAATIAAARGAWPGRRLVVCSHGWVEG